MHLTDNVGKQRPHVDVALCVSSWAPWSQHEDLGAHLGLRLTPPRHLLESCLLLLRKIFATLSSRWRGGVRRRSW